MRQTRGMTAQENPCIQQDIRDGPPTAPCNVHNPLVLFCIIKKQTQTYVAALCFQIREGIFHLWWSPCSIAVHCGEWGARQCRGSACGRPVPRAAAGLLRPRGSTGTSALVEGRGAGGHTAPEHLCNSGDPSKLAINTVTVIYIVPKSRLCYAKTSPFFCTFPLKIYGYL